MTSGMTAFMVAVGGTSLVCFVLMNRGQARKTRRENDGGDTSGTGPGDSSEEAGARSPGSAATVLRRIIPALPATSAGTVAEAVGIAGAVTAAAAIDAENPGNIGAPA